ncbi:MAG: ABC transporter ATP-binding protein [Treponema sp.]|nr:ABC transporter ATP-binding protein [Treponema sp.]
MTLKLRDLTKSYGDFSVRLEFEAGPGETLALVGPSGSGKTTALNLISGLALSDSGQIFSGDEDISALPPWKRNIAVVFQDLALFPHLDVEKNIAYGLFLRRVPQAERKRIAQRMLDLVRLPDFGPRRIHTLSGGERQRVAIARALAASPRALLLDEPFSSLDAPLRSSLRREFLAIRASDSAAAEAPCIFVTHDQEEAVMLGDRVALMKDGQVLEIGTGQDLVLSPRYEFTARFFGAGQVLPCQVQGEGNQTEITCPLGLLHLDGQGTYERASPKIFIPNDALSLEEQRGPGWKKIPARLAHRYYRGQDFLIDLVLPPQGGFPEWSLELQSGPRTELPPQGSTLDLWVDQSLIRFVL